MFLSLTNHSSSMPTVTPGTRLRHDILVAPFPSLVPLVSTPHHQTSQPSPAVLCASLPASPPTPFPRGLFSLSSILP
ncbi:hypothetical protein RRG08_031844 [Elysia crispata]|uniref:Uncharacterized protein n=1 Tax=Elysia crispata TaxID=231223 RepID=A0AAE0Y5M7_9GAST|nr:hypothetical protein RRG08_031844 [Elysia crispata]